jgi:hypothetical protein
MPQASRFGMVASGAVCLTVLVLAACTAAPSPNTVHPPPPSPVDFRLPAPLYFVREGQVWRLARDAATPQQITDEATPITDLDVSPVDGTLVYLTDNRLVHADADGEGGRVLVTGPPLPSVESTLASLNDERQISGKIAGPRWSPDGDRVAYVQNGLNVVSVSSGEIQTVSANDRIPNRGEERLEDPLLYETVIAWSPDGMHLLVQVYRYPLTSIYYRSAAIKTLAGGRTIMWDCVPCDYVWSADSQEIYVARPSQGGTEALARFVLERNMGQHLAQYVPARTAFYYAHPHPLSQDELCYFMGTGPDGGDPPKEFKLYRGPTHVTGGSTLLREGSWSMETALWAADGSGVLVVTSSVSDKAEAGTLVWLPADGSPAIALPVTGARTLRWGVSSE